jgi:hypothetical protein
MLKRFSLGEQRFHYESGYVQRSGAIESEEFGFRADQQPGE